MIWRWSLLPALLLWVLAPSEVESGTGPQFVGVALEGAETVDYEVVEAWFERDRNGAGAGGTLTFRLRRTSDRPSLPLVVSLSHRDRSGALSAGALSIFDPELRLVEQRLFHRPVELPDPAPGDRLTIGLQDVGELTAAPATCESHCAVCSRLASMECAHGVAEDACRCAVDAVGCTFLCGTP